MRYIYYVKFEGNHPIRIEIKDMNELWSKLMSFGVNHIEWLACERVYKIYTGWKEYEEVG